MQMTLTPGAPLQIAAVDIMCADFAEPLMHRLRHTVDLLVWSPLHCGTWLQSDNFGCEVVFSQAFLT